MEHFPWGSLHSIVFFCMASSVSGWRRPNMHWSTCACLDMHKSPTNKSICRHWLFPFWIILCTSFNQLKSLPESSAHMMGLARTPDWNLPLEACVPTWSPFAPMRSGLCGSRTPGCRDRWNGWLACSWACRGTCNLRHLRSLRTRLWIDRSQGPWWGSSVDRCSLAGPVAYLFGPVELLHLEDFPCVWLLSSRVRRTGCSSKELLADEVSQLGNLVLLILDFLDQLVDWVHLGLSWKTASSATSTMHERNLQLLEAIFYLIVSKPESYPTWLLLD